MIDAIKDNPLKPIVGDVAEEFDMLYDIEKYPEGDTIFRKVHEEIKEMSPPKDKKLILLHSDLVVLTADMVNVYNAYFINMMSNEIGSVEMATNNIIEMQKLGRKALNLRNRIISYGIDN